MSTYQRNGLGAIIRNRFQIKRLQRGAAWGGMILCALIAFEVFNFSTTQFALLDVLGNLDFAGMSWATILAIAFCGIDFAGIARIFTPEQGRDEPVEIWYLFGAWLLAAFMNASLTWWGVSVAISNHTSASGDAVISATTMTKVVPIFVASMILFIRILLISTFSVAGDRLFTTEENRGYISSARPRPAVQQGYRPVNQPVLRPASSLNRPVANNSMYRPVQKSPVQTSFSRSEPTYHNVSFNGYGDNDRYYDS